MSAERYFTDLAAAFVRGRLSAAVPPGMDPGPTTQLGLDAGLRLHGFKRSAELPRVRKVLGILRALAPQSLLDVGSGRGAFLWPVLDAFPSLPVVAVDRNPRRAADVQSVHQGGVPRVHGICADCTHLPLRDGAVDVVTILEVLEHLPNPERAAAEALRIARRCAIASVPARPDDNPEHVSLFSAGAIERLFVAAGAERVTVEFVHNHMVAVARVSR